MKGTPHVLSLWRRLPVVVRAVVAGLIVSLGGVLPWSGINGVRGLAGWNMHVLMHVPWVIVPMTAYLWLYWRYLGGAGWPRATSEARRISLRANPVPGEIWGLALFAGLIGLAALLPLLGVLSRLVQMPAEAAKVDIPAQMPFITTFLLLVMGAIVAGVVEEAAFRGYMQGPIERRHGPIVAILVNGVVFGFAHYSHHPAAVVAMLPFYVAVVAVYGGLAWATNSILPGVVLHAGGDVFSLTRLWVTGLPEWQTSSAPSPLVWQTGLDAAFIGSAAMFLLLSAGAVWAYRELATAARAARPVET